MRIRLFGLWVVLLSLMVRGENGARSTNEEGSHASSKHIVFLAGDEEYRSEEGLPMLAKILRQHHGFQCDVCFSLNDDGTINPNRAESLSHPEALDRADVIVMLTRFRHWPDATMKKFAAAVQRGVPIIGLRTSTHAFAGFPEGSPWESWNYNRNGGWGQKIFGETWIAHWGKHKVEATRAEIEPSAADDEILRGVSNIFGTTDVYESYPPSDAKILLRGVVLKGMNPSDPPATYSKKRSTDHVEQEVNNPRMPIAWTRELVNESGQTNRILCTTMGAATDLTNEGLRRLIVNGVYWGLHWPVPANADVDIVGSYHPTMYEFDGFKHGVKATEVWPGN